MRLLIVDDDYQIREGIQYAVDWKPLGVDAVETAANGFEALEKMKQNLPDIILADIQMPGMTGLEMLERIRTQNTGCRIIFISAYSDFDYCREALRLGANDYILKPIQMRVLEELVRKHVREMIAERQEQSERTRMSVEMECRAVYETRQKTDGRLIAHLLENEYPFLKDGYLITAVILPVREENFVSENNQTIRQEEKKESILMHVFQMLSELWKKEKERLLLLPPVDNKLILWYKGSNSALETLYYQKNLQTLLESGFRTAKREGYRLTAGISASGSITELDKFYDCALDIMGLLFYHPERSVFIQGEQNMKNALPEELLHCMVEIIQLIRRKEQGQDKRSRIHAFFGQMERFLDKNPVKPEILRRELIRIIWNEDSIDSQNYEQLIRRTSLCNDWKHFSSCIEDYFLICLEDSGLEKNEKTLSHGIRLAISFIRENYTKSVGISEAAEIAGMSPNHFSSQFKKETGMAMTDYVTMLRMKKAKKLALNTNMKVNEIGEACGFTGYMYFSRIFRQTFGCSVSEMRNKGTDGSTSV